MAELWQQWIQDETSAAQGRADLEYVETLYRRAVADYLSVPLWHDMLMHVLTLDVENEARVRGVAEEAITAVGTILPHGHVIWRVLRSYEMELLRATSEHPATTAEQVEAQTERLRKLFRRQLAVPLAGNEQLLQEYRRWERELDAPSAGDRVEAVRPQYERALRERERRVAMEEALAALLPAGVGAGGYSPATQQQALPLWRDYIEMEHRAGNMSAVCVLFERALAVCCLVPDLWREYGDFLVHKLRSAGAAQAAYTRGTRNCPWDHSLWAGRMRALEAGGGAVRASAADAEEADAIGPAMPPRAGAAKEAEGEVRATSDALEEVLLRGLGQQFGAYEPYLHLALLFCEIARRAGGAEQPTQLLPAAVNSAAGGADASAAGNDGAQAHAAAVASLEWCAAQWEADERLAGWADGLHTLRQFVATVLAESFGALDRARAVMERAVRQRGREAGVWADYVAMERAARQFAKCRSLYRRAIYVVADFPDAMLDAYLRFEQQCGTAEENRVANERCAERRAELQLRQAQVAMSQAAGVQEGVAQGQPAQAAAAAASGWVMQPQDAKHAGQQRGGRRGGAAGRGRGRDAVAERGRRGRPSVRARHGRMRLDIGGSMRARDAEVTEAGEGAPAGDAAAASTAGSAADAGQAPRKRARSASGGSVEETAVSADAGAPPTKRARAVDTAAAANGEAAMDEDASTAVDAAAAADTSGTSRGSAAHEDDGRAAGEAAPPAPAGEEQQSTLFVKNLDFSIDESQLRGVFAKVRLWALQCARRAGLTACATIVWHGGARAAGVHQDRALARIWLRHLCHRGARSLLAAVGGRCPLRPAAVSVAHCCTHPPPLAGRAAARSASHARRGGGGPPAGRVTLPCRSFPPAQPRRPRRRRGRRTGWRGRHGG